MVECGEKSKSREQRSCPCEGDILQAIGSFTWLFFWRCPVQYLACEKPSKWNANEHQSYQLDNEVSFPQIIFRKPLLVNCSNCVGQWTSLMISVSLPGISNSDLRQTASPQNGLRVMALDL